METRSLGASALRVTPVIFGAWAVGGYMWGGTDEAASVDAVRAGLDAGIDTVDTAPVYGFGLSEELVGRAIADRPHVQVATKCGLRWDRTDGALRFENLDASGRPVKVYYNLSPSSIREECEASLRRLGRDTIDLYQIHWPDPDRSLEEAFAELVRLRDEGKVRAIGVSNFDVAQLEVARACDALASTQPSYSLLDRRIEADVLPWCRARDVGVICYSPMGRGLLTGKITPDTELPETDHRSGHRWFTREVRTAVHDALQRVRPIADAHGISLANLAVAWVLGAPGVTAALVGARTVAQAVEAARAASVALTDAERRQIAEAFAGIGD